MEWPTILIFAGALLSAAGALWWNARRVGFEQQLAAKSTEIAELNEAIAASVTGGDSYAYVQPIELGGYFVTNVGDYPLYDVSIEIMDRDEFAQLPSDYTLVDLTRIKHSVEVGNLAPHTGRSLEIDYPQLDNETLHYGSGLDMGLFTKI